MKSDECECGNEKSTKMDACNRCTYLDGTARWGFIIDALRGTDGLTLAELAAITGKHREALQRTFKRLLEIGRVRRYLRETDGMEVTRNMFGKGRRTARIGAPEQWVYILDGDWERAACATSSGTTGGGVRK